MPVSHRTDASSHFLSGVRMIVSARRHAPDALGSDASDIRAAGNAQEFTSLVSSEDLDTIAFFASVSTEAIGLPPGCLNEAVRPVPLRRRRCYRYLAKREACMEAGRTEAPKLPTCNAPTPGQGFATTPTLFKRERAAHHWLGSPQKKSATAFRVSGCRHHAWLFRTQQCPRAHSSILVPARLSAPHLVPAIRPRSPPISSCHSFGYVNAPRWCDSCYRFATCVKL